MKTRNVVFKSGVKSYSEEPAVATNVLQLDGIYYVIGESHKVFIANKDEDDDYYTLMSLHGQPNICHGLRRCRKGVEIRPGRRISISRIRT